MTETATKVLLLVVLTSATPRKAAADLDGLSANLTALLQGPQNIGPVYYKTVEAALYTALPYAPATLESLDVDDAVAIPYADGTGNLWVFWKEGNTSSSVHLAFQSPSAQVTAEIQQGRDRSVFPYTGGLVTNTSATPHVNTAALDAFNSVLQPSGSNISSLIEIITQGGVGGEPRRILCTGHFNGGSLATLCGPWAANAFPSAFIRVITFGAPKVGDPAFDEVVEQLVDLHYAWEQHADMTGHDLTLSGQGRRLQQDIEDSLEQVEDSVESAANQLELNAELAEDELEAYLENLIANVGTGNINTNLAGQNRSDGLSTLTDGNSTFNCAQDNNCTLKDFVVALEDDVIAHETLKELFNGDATTATKQSLLQTTPAPAPGSSIGTTLNETEYELWPSDCQPILCKVQPQVIAACRIYEQNLTEPSAFIVTPQFDANVGVQWDPATNTALFVFQGSISNTDWILDFLAVLTDAPTTSVLEEVYPDAAVHWGFLKQAQSVTDKSAPQYNLRNVLSSLNGGAEPAHIFVTGHSLGAAVATLIGPWAALQWPAADVRVSTFGSPAVGNEAFTQAYRSLVGRQYRVVNEADIVPALPGFGSYVHVNHSLWHHDEQLVAANRPDAPVNTFDWPDHACGLYQGALLLADNITLLA
ncbi:hypothetical protein ABBQ32_000254 [Trebouxia sp. C0010 RCD-2024]